MSLLPAVLVISVICIPYLTKATETPLNQVPSVVAISRRHAE